MTRIISATDQVLQELAAIADDLGDLTDEDKHAIAQTIIESRRAHALFAQRCLKLLNQRVPGVRDQLLKAKRTGKSVFEFSRLRQIANDVGYEREHDEALVMIDCPNRRRFYEV